MKKLKEDNKEKWLNNNQLVKEIFYYENGQKQYEYYWLNGKLHREGGPAHKSWYENGQKELEEYWLNNKELTKNEFIILNRKRKIKLFL